MALSNTFIEDLRLELQTKLQDLLSYGGGPTLEFKVVNEFNDNPEIYPCVVIDITNASSPARHIGTRDKNLINITMSILSIRPTSNNHIITCEDTVKRSGRGLVEYGAIKIRNYLELYKLDFQTIDTDIEMVLNLDYEEREDIFKAEVGYTILV